MVGQIPKELAEKPGYAANSKKLPRAEAKALARGGFFASGDGPVEQRGHFGPRQGGAGIQTADTVALEDAQAHQGTQ